jgi:nitroreductase
MTVLPLTPGELLTTTRSVRKRLDLTRPVPMDLITECLKISLQAPSGGNQQGWYHAQGHFHGEPRVRVAEPVAQGPFELADAVAGNGPGRKLIRTVLT